MQREDSRTNAQGAGQRKGWTPRRSIDCGKDPTEQREPQIVARERTTIVEPAPASQ